MHDKPLKIDRQIRSAPLPPNPKDSMIVKSPTLFLALVSVSHADSIPWFSFEWTSGSVGGNAPNGLNASRVYFTALDGVMYSEVAWTSEDVSHMKPAKTRNPALVASIIRRSSSPPRDIDIGSSRPAPDMPLRPIHSMRSGI